MHPDLPPVHDVNPAPALRADATICLDCDRFGREMPLETWATFPPDLNVLSDSDFFPLPECDGGSGASCGMTPHESKDRAPAPLVAPGVLFAACAAIGCAVLVTVLAVLVVVRVI